ncbi:MAG: metal-dependent hydrolase [Deltaproteobacteria bacterium]|nr:metal-dependent hydrolase [Deltaproteobacteria bacterium]
MARLTWHGHACFQLEDGKAKVLIDPWFEGNPSARQSWKDVGPVDMVLVTHDHGDHIGQALEICTATGAMLGAQVELAGAMKAKGLPQSRILNGIGFNVGGTVAHVGFKATMVPAFHSSAAGTPVGFIIKTPSGLHVYHAGDTCIFSSMEIWGRLYPLDVALLPMGGVFTMDPRQAAMACGLLKCRKVVPMHWGTFPCLEQDAESFGGYLREFARNTEHLDLKAGQGVEL